MPRLLTCHHHWDPPRPQLHPCNTQTWPTHVLAEVKLLSAVGLCVTCLHKQTSPAPSPLQLLPGPRLSTAAATQSCGQSICPAEHNGSRSPPGLTVRLRPLSTRCVGRPGYAKATPCSSRLPCSVPLSGMKSPAGLSRGRRLINSMTWTGSTWEVHGQYVSRLQAVHQQHRRHGKAQTHRERHGTAKDYNSTALHSTAQLRTPQP
jgi:hypothetical protein